MDSLISSYKDFCNQQGMSIEEIDVNFFKGQNRCRYSEFYKKCLPIKIINLKTKLDSINLQIEKEQANMSILQNADSILENENKLLLEIKYRSEMNKIKHLNNVLNRTSDEPKEEEIDGYEDLYNRIDKYLKLIKNQPINEYYKNISRLLELYGRSGSVIDGENIDFY